MPKRPRTFTALAALVGAVLIGAGAGAATYAGFSNSSSKTVVRQVTVADSQPTSTGTSLSVSDVYKRSYRGVVEITVTSAGQTGPFGGSGTQQAQGSGFVYDDSGHIVTNEHVVDGAQSISVRFWNGATYKATLVGSDSSTDLAVIKVDAPSSVLHPLTLGDSTKVAVGEGVVAIGSPFGLEETVTSGIVSALHRSMQAPNNFTINDSIQTDAAINHGNSGGPLLDLDGHVIGVNAQIQSDSGGSEGVGFAIPANTVRSVAGQLISSGNVQHAYLGVAVTTANGAVRVSQVRSGTPAQRAGLHVGDLIRSVDGKRVTAVTQLQSAIDARQPGDTITIRYTRNGNAHTVRVKLANRPS
jgi:putative serine protease PepD